MFKKKPNIKPLAPLRSSDRRRTADNIIKDLSLPEIAVPETASAEEKAAAVTERARLRNNLLPDNALSARFTTTHGPELRQISGTVYVGSHEGEEQRVLWVKMEERMYPTVYTLWRNPGILPLVHCGSNVIQRLQGGADLMTPGLVYGPPFPENAKKDALIAVAGHDRPSVPVVVGTCEIDISELREVQGAKGRAVLTAHWSGDELWSWSASGNPGGAVPEHIEGWLKGDEADELRERIENFDLQEDGDKEGEIPSADSKPTNGKLSYEPEVVEEEVKEMTTKEIDDTFLSAILYGINTFKSTHPNTPNYGLDFPLTQSFIMANLVNPFLPTFTPHQTAQLQIKKSSWKNIKKFVKHLDKLQLLKAKDQGVHEVVIFDIDFEDRSILEFKPYRLPKREVASQAKEEEQVISGDSSVGQTLKLISLYKPKEKLAEFFEVTKKDPRGFYTAAEVKGIVNSYIDAEELVSANNKRLVNLNPFLANSVFDPKNGAMDKEILSKGFSPRDNISDRVLTLCAPFHLIQRSSSSTSSTTTEKPKAGAPPKIQILLETRSGNKTVTKVSGLEAYFISPQPLADELRKVCAGSTSVERLQGSSPKNPVMEVMVQGPQRDAVIKALERRGVNGKWVDVVDKTKKKKK